MATYTEKLNLIKPEEDDFYNVEDQNNNMDLVDEEFIALENPVYETPSAVEGLESGEDYKMIFGKIARAILNLISHLVNKNNPHGLTKSQIGLGNVNNTSDLNKPVSMATQTAINASYQQSTGYADTKINALVNGAPETLDTLKEVADAIAENESVVDALNAAIGTKASQVELDTHEGNSTIHITASDRSAWNAKQGAVTMGTNTTSTGAPTPGNTFTAIDSVTKDANGHVTKVNTKTVTIPAVKHDGVSDSGKTSITHYSTCATAAATAAKAAALTGFSLVTGSHVQIKFTYANTAASPTLNVNSTGAKAVKIYGTTAVPAAMYWGAGDIVDFIYDGTSFIMCGVPASVVNDLNTNLSNYIKVKSVSVSSETFPGNSDTSMTVTLTPDTGYKTVSPIYVNSNDGSILCRGMVRSGTTNDFIVYMNNHNSNSVTTGLTVYFIEIKDL